MENDRIKIYWDLRVRNLAKIKYTQPDMVIFDKVKLQIWIVEIGVSWHTRLQQGLDIKYGKYAIDSNQIDLMDLPYPPGESLVGEMQRVNRGHSAEVIPIIVGCTGEVQRSVYDGLAKIGITWHQILTVIEKMQRSVVIGTSRLIRAHLAKES